MDNNSKDIHEQNKKRIEYYVNRIQSLNDSGEEIKMVIEDSFENQEKEYDENNKKKPKKKELSLVPLFIIIVLGINLIIYNHYGDDNIFIPFMAIAISLYILYKYVPKKAKKKFVKEFEETISKLINLFLFNKDINREKEIKKYISVSSEDQNKLLKDEDKEEEKEDN